MKVVRRGIDNILATVNKYPILKRYISIELITERAEDITTLNKSYRTPPIAITGYLLPRSYKTTNNTLLKARGLHYMVEQHRKTPTKNSYVVHYDEESVFTPDNLARLVHELLSHPVAVSEGQISYGLDWKEAAPLCRAMESNRPFGCHECYIVMNNPPPSHIHGSNLVVNQQLENEIGWDIGQYKENALVAEDLTFGLQVYLKYGSSVFGWHRAEMYETPPFTVKAAVKQRERWVFGALQAVNHMQDMAEWKNLSQKEKLRIKGMIYLKIFTYALGFPISLFSMTLNIFLLGYTGYVLAMTHHLLPVSMIELLLAPGLFMWLGAMQYGLYFNIRSVNLSQKEKMLEHIKILILTPIAGIVETYGPFVTVVRWVSGVRSLVWVPTPKHFVPKTYTPPAPYGNLELGSMSYVEVGV